MLYSDLRKPIAIIGMGVTGHAVLELLTEAGLSRADILTHDRKESSDVPDAQDFLRLPIENRPQTLIVSPGVPLSSPWIQDLKSTGVQVTSELDLAARVLKSEKIIGITGAVGKSTVTSLIGAGLKAAGIPSFIGGNLGIPLARYAIEVLRSERGRADWLILELSSYQLENFSSLRCDSSIQVSLTPNHMERYATLDEYYQTKLSLIGKTNRFCLFNRSGLELSKFESKYQGPHMIWTDHRDSNIDAADLKRSQLIGRHNMDNVALALRLGQLLQFQKPYVEGVLAFRGLSHRLENLGEIDGVLFLNDSKATTVASVLQAVESIQELITSRNRTWVLIGGKDKNLPWGELGVLQKQSRIRFVFFGEVGERARDQSGLQGDYYPKLANLMDAVLPQLKARDLVLLSPGGTSWDEFRSFEERGEFFKTQIAKR